jgi:hypothetical protein
MATHIDYTFKDFANALWHSMNPSDFTRFQYFAFLIQYDIFNLRILKTATKYMHSNKPVTRTRFYIGYRRIIEIEDDFEPTELPKQHKIPHVIEKRITNILAKYNKLTTGQLTHLIRKKLGLIPIEKHGDYLGYDIDRYLRIEKFKIIKKEI